MLMVFCADPRILSRPKLPWRWAFSAVGDLRGDFKEPLPFVVARAGIVFSTEKLSLLGIANGLTVLAVVVVVDERGESPVDEGDIVAQTALVARVEQAVRIEPRPSPEEGPAAWPDC